MLIALFNFFPQSLSLINGCKNTLKKHLRLIKKKYST